MNSLFILHVAIMLQIGMFGFAIIAHSHADKVRLVRKINQILNNGCCNFIISNDCEDNSANTSQIRIYSFMANGVNYFRNHSGSINCLAFSP